MILASCLLLLATSLGEDQAIGAAAIDSDAVEAYRAGDHAAALARWDELLCTRELAEAERSRLLYNAGNAAARGGEWLAAVGYYSEALAGTPRDGDLWANLEHARREAGLEPEDRGDLAATLGRLLSAWTESEARWIAALGMVLLAAVLAHEALRGGRSGRTLAWVGLGLALLMSAPLARHVLADEAQRVFIISDGPIALRSEPRADAQVLERAKAGTWHRELDRLGGWIGVRTRSGAKGWVPMSGVLALPSAP